MPALGAQRHHLAEEEREPYQAQNQPRFQQISGGLKVEYGGKYPKTMKWSKGGTEVPEGIYFNPEVWEFVQVDVQSSPLPGDSRAK